jgi:threonine dehydratase
MFPIAQTFVSGVILVTDDAIQQAQLALWKDLRIVAEPGGAAAFAALLSGRYKPPPGERIGVLVCGGNTAAVDYARSAGAASKDYSRSFSSKVASPSIKGD